jgi:hypothetical protein
MTTTSANSIAYQEYVSKLPYGLAIRVGGSISMDAIRRPEICWRRKRTALSNIKLYHWWEGKNSTEDRIFDKLAAFVNGLPQFDKIYDSWLAKPGVGEDVLLVPTDIAACQSLLEKSEMKNDLGEPWPELGSKIWAGHAGPKPYDFRPESYADTSGLINASTKGLPFPNHIFMRLSEKRLSTRRPWRASELRPLMKFTRSIWNPSRMCAMFPFYTRSLPEIADPTWAAGKRSLQPWIGWITYLPPDLAARARYPSNVEVETLEDGAALVTLCEEPFGPTDTQGLARLHALEAALRPIQS